MTGILPDALAGQLGGTPPSDQAIKHNPNGTQIATGGVIPGAGLPAAMQPQPTNQNLQPVQPGATTHNLMTSDSGAVNAAGQPVQPQVPGQASVAIGTAAPAGHQGQIATSTGQPVHSNQQPGAPVQPGLPQHQVAGQGVQQPGAQVPGQPSHPTQPGLQPDATAAPVLNPDSKIRIQNADGTITEITASDALAFQQSQAALAQAGQQPTTVANVDTAKINETVQQQFNNRGGQQIADRVRQLDTQLNEQRTEIANIDHALPQWEKWVGNPENMKRQDYQLQSNKYSSMMARRTQLETSIGNASREADSLIAQAQQLRTSVVATEMGKVFPSLATQQGINDTKMLAGQFFGYSPQEVDQIMLNPKHTATLMHALSHLRVVGSNAAQVASAPQVQPSVILNAAGAQPNQTQVSGIPATVNPVNGNIQDSVNINYLATQYNQALQNQQFERANQIMIEMQGIIDVPADLRSGYNSVLSH